MKCSPMVAALASLALALPALALPTYADECVKTCNAEKDACLSAPDAHRPTCTSNYATCLGYNPYETEPFVEPTKCVVAAKPVPEGGASEDGAACASRCKAEKDTCLTAPDAHRPTCTSNYATCLGYNPYEAEPFVEPTKCAAAAKPVPEDGAACASHCKAEKDTCLTAPDAHRPTCTSNYATCLGYNPYETEPFVEPTTCHTPSAAPGTAGSMTPGMTNGTIPEALPVVGVNSGYRSQPVAAVVVLGLLALL